MRREIERDRDLAIRHSGAHGEYAQARLRATAATYVRGKGRESGTLRRIEGKVGRNEPCPCGNGKKFKRCHYDSLVAGRYR